MEVNDWIPGGKESFTTPGGRFRPPADGSGKTYSFTRGDGARPESAPRPASGAPAPSAPVVPVSPFAPSASAAPAGAPEPSAVPVSGAEGAAVTVRPPAPGGPPVYTIQLPAPAPRQSAQKKRSLWWLPLLLLAALLAGLLLGALLYPVLQRQKTPSASTEPGPAELSEKEIYRENLSAVVSVSAARVTGYSSGQSVGTGFLISEDGYLLTNGHVVDGATSLMVTLSSGQSYPARLAALELERSDLALLKIEAGGLRAVAVGDSDSVEVGDRVCTIGNPLGTLEFSLTTGVVSAGAREVRTEGGSLTMLQTNAAVNKGNSGGPLFDAAGRVVGVVTAKLSGSESESLEGLGFALPINDVMALVRPWLDADRGQ